MLASGAKLRECPKLNYQDKKIFYKAIVLKKTDAKETTAQSILEISFYL